MKRKHELVPFYNMQVLYVSRCKLRVFHKIKITRNNLQPFVTMTKIQDDYLCVNVASFISFIQTHSQFLLFIDSCFRFINNGYSV